MLPLGYLHVVTFLKTDMVEELNHRIAPLQLNAITIGCDKNCYFVRTDASYWMNNPIFRIM
jgi:hypothetical protein